MKLSTLPLVAGTICLLMTTSAMAQNSIWLRRNPAFSSQVTDVKARKPGDLLIVQINERSNVQNRDQRTMQKQNGSSSDASVSGGLSGFFGDEAGQMSFDQESAASRQFNGNSQFRSERGFIDQFTVSIVDVTPNGNMLVSGSRNVAVEGDTRKLILTGIVRASDITAGNTIPSSRIADLDIRYEATGEEGAEQKFINQGWLGKKLNRWWPH